MLRRGKTFVKTKSLEFEDSYRYEEDFEELEEAEDDDNRLIEGLSACSPQHSEASTSTETSGKTDSLVGSNERHRNRGAGDYEEFEEDYEDDEDFSESFDLRSFHDALAEMNISRPKLFKNGTRSSLTFSNERVREIERHNQLLLKKIMQNGPADELGSSAALAPKKKTKLKPQQPVVRSAAEVNRRKQQMKIDYENSILKRKLDKIAARRAKLS